jgi:hypothetical protein
MPQRAFASNGCMPAADSKADRPMSWTTPWSNAELGKRLPTIATEREKTRKIALSAARDLLRNADSAIRTTAADHGVVRDNAAAYVHIQRLHADG